MSTKAYVPSLPACDLHHDRRALYDFRTLTGTWMYGCPACFAMYGRGLGTGKGQFLIVRKRPDAPLPNND